MINPKEVITVIAKSSYNVPLFGVDSNGLYHAEDYRIDFCKGNKEDPAVRRQVGFFTETLIATAKKYLEENNVGDLASVETGIVIQKLEDVLFLINKRSQDRKNRGVQGTHQK